MRTLEDFEKRSVQTYDQIDKELKRLGKVPSFYTPNHKVALSGKYFYRLRIKI